MSGSEPSPPATKVDWARRIAAGLIFLSLTVLVVASYYPGGPQVCREELASNSTVVTLCRPFGTDDVVSIGLILALVLLLLAPDLSEFGIGSLFNVKLRQRVAAAERKADAAVTEAAYATLGSPVPSVASIRQATANAGAKIVPSPEDRAAAARILGTERQTLEVQLAGIAHQLDRYIALLARPNARTAVLVRERARALGTTRQALESRVREWRTRYATELSEWGRVRNTLVHFPERLSDDGLRAGIELGTRLLDAVEDRPAN